MKVLPTTPRARVHSLLAPLGMLVGACFLAVAVQSSSADGGGPFLPGGGDAIGSLPKNFIPGSPEGGAQGVQAQKPSIVFEGPDLESIETLIVDAFGQGHADVFAPDAFGRVRVELQGRVTAVLDRARLNTLGVSVRLDVSQGFSGGMGIFSQGSRTSGIQVLPAQGDLSLPLVQLEQSGVLDAGPVVLHSVSLQLKHHILEMSGSGGTLRLSSRD